MAPRPSAHTTSHSDPTRSSSPLPLRFPPSEAWLFGFSQADPGSDASPRLCVHFAKQQKFIAQVIDRGAAASLHLTRCPHSFLPTLLSLFSQCTICGVREKEAKKGGVSSHSSANYESHEPQFPHPQNGVANNTCSQVCWALWMLGLRGARVQCDFTPQSNPER